MRVLQRRANSLFASAALLLCAVSPLGAQTTDMTVTVRPITAFEIGRDTAQFGPLTFLGGLEMLSYDQHFGALSGIDMADDGNSAFIVTDTGYLLHADLTRDEKGRVTALNNVTRRELTGEDGKPLPYKWLADAEGISVDGNNIRISFERNHRIDTFRLEGDALRLVASIKPPVPLYELRENRGFEGIDIMPPDAPLAGALIGISEKSLDKNGNIMGFIAPENGKSFEFSLRRNEDFDVTDIATLPGGDVIVLERRFNISQGVAMRLRMIKADMVQPGATIDAEVMMVADMTYQIDNMEGLDVWRAPDGQLRLTLVSDDNKSLLQRNLFLEFTLPAR